MASRLQGTRFKSADSPPAPFIRDRLHPRVIYFPPSIIEKHDAKPGQLIELVTVALSNYLKSGEVPSTITIERIVNGKPVQPKPDDHAPPAITWTRTASGGSVDLVKPNPADIRIEDIAAALAKLCRFSGHTKEHYSVAQHSVIVARLCPPELRLAGLLHDAAECFTADLPTPVKAVLSMQARAEFKMLEARLMIAIGQAFKVDLMPNATVKHFDRVALRAEAELLLPMPIAGFADLPSDPVPPITPWRADVAERNFLHEFRLLTEKPKKTKVKRPAKVLA